MAFNITDFSNKWANFKEELKDYFNKRVVDKNGDTMQGSLILASLPIEDMDAVPKIYVDNYHVFKPGNTLLTEGRTSCFGGTLEFDNYDYTNQSFSSTGGSFVPSASGVLRVKNVLTLSKSIPEYLGSGQGWLITSTQSGFNHDVKIKITLTYKYGNNSETLWEKSDISLKEEYSGTGVGLVNGITVDVEVPVVYAQMSSIISTVTIQDYTYRPGSGNYPARLTKTPTLSNHYKIGTSSPIYNLSYSEV